MLFIFDMGGVVTSTFDGDLLYKKLNLTKDDFFKICNYSSENIWTLFECGKISSNEFWNLFNINVKTLQRESIDKLLLSKESSRIHIVSNLSQVPEVNNDLFRLYFHPETIVKTVELISQLKKKHRVVCGTNTNQSHWENHLERGDYSYFHQTYASNKIGCVKPEKTFFEIILEAENYKAKETFFTDDKLENCIAAKNVGINAIQFTNAESLYNAWKLYI